MTPLPWLAMVAALSAEPRTAAPPAPDAADLARVPAGPTTLNLVVVEILGSYPTDGRLPYAWAPGQHTDGVSRPVAWRGSLLATPDPGGALHCSGITFEVFVRALQRAVERGERVAVSGAEVEAIKDLWYLRTGDERGPVAALLALGLGQPVERLEDLQPGDFVQFWRNSGKGHSAVFTRHLLRRDGTVRGMEFWSAQASSSGPGRRYVSVGPSEHQIAPGRLHAARVVVPAG